MNSRIAYFLSRINISPVKYTWMDLCEYYVTQEEWDAVLGRVGRLNSLPILDYPLPFEQTAVVTLTSPQLSVYGDGNNDSVTLSTIERVNDELVYTFHLYMLDSKYPAVIGKVRHTPTPPELREDSGVPEYGKAMTFSFEKKYKEMATRHGITEDILMKAHGDHLSAVIRKLVSLSVKPDPVVPVCRPYGDEARNAKRRRKGKSQFWEWKTIELKSTVALPSAPLGGTHASPKPHERMGHWRQYKSGKRVFIKAHIVNKHKIETDGFVFHDYVKH